MIYRSASDGMSISVVADNYFGFCKKEIKSVISFAANLRGLS